MTDYNGLVKLAGEDLSLNKDTENTLTPQNIKDLVERYVHGIEGYIKHANPRDYDTEIKDACLAIINYCQGYRITNIPALFEALQKENFGSNKRPITINNIHIIKAVLQMQAADNTKKLTLLLKLSIDPCDIIMHGNIKFSESEVKDLLPTLAEKLQGQSEAVLTNVLNNIPDNMFSSLLNSRAGKRFPVLQRFFPGQFFHKTETGKKLINTAIEKNKFIYDNDSKILGILSDEQLAKALDYEIFRAIKPGDNAKTMTIEETGNFKTIADYLKGKMLQSEEPFKAMFNASLQVELDCKKESDNKKQTQLYAIRIGYHHCLNKLFDAMPIERRIVWLGTMPININTLKAINTDQPLTNAEYLSEEREYFLSRYLASKIGQLEAAEKKPLDQKAAASIPVIKGEITQFLVQLGNKIPEAIHRLSANLILEENKHHLAIQKSFEIALQDENTSLDDAKSLFKLICEQDNEVDEQSHINTIMEIFVSLHSANSNIIKQRLPAFIANLQEGAYKEALNRYYFGNSFKEFFIEKGKELEAKRNAVSEEKNKPEKDKKKKEFAAFKKELGQLIVQQAKGNPGLIKDLCTALSDESNQDRDYIKFCFIVALNNSHTSDDDAKHLFSLINQAYKTEKEIKITADIIYSLPRPKTETKIKENRQAKLLASINDPERKAKIFKTLVDTDCDNKRVKRTFEVTMDAKNEVPTDTYRSSLIFASTSFSASTRAKILLTLSEKIKADPPGSILNVILNNSSASCDLNSTQLAEILKIKELRQDKDLIKEIFYHYHFKTLEDIIDLNQFNSPSSKQQLAEVFLALIEDYKDKGKHKKLVEMVIDLAVKNPKLFNDIYQKFTLNDKAALAKCLIHSTDNKKLSDLHAIFDITSLVTGKDDRMILLDKVFDNFFPACPKELALSLFNTLPEKEQNDIVYGETRKDILKILLTCNDTPITRLYSYPIPISTLTEIIYEKLRKGPAEDCYQILKHGLLNIDHKNAFMKIINKFIDDNKNKNDANLVPLTGVSNISLYLTKENRDYLEKMTLHSTSTPHPKPR